MAVNDYAWIMDRLGRRLSDETAALRNALGDRHAPIAGALSQLELGVLEDVTAALAFLLGAVVEHEAPFAGRLLESPW